MAFRVLLTEDAERDLDELVTYIAQHDSRRNAEHVLGRILDIADSLTAEPTRGSTPQELRALGDQEYRQVFFKPYRLIYRVVEQQVVIYLIADGRRDFQTLLARRLLGGC
jgi:toxin ParE1/3/4